MFFGLCNSPMTFQTMMNNILQDFIHNGEAICCMDNILVYSCTLSDHWQIICQVLSTLQKWRLFLKPEKCKFEQKEVEYLRLVISKDHVAMDLTKVCGVTEWLTPMKVKEVQSFLGFVNFYQKFICDFSNIAHPLYALTHKTQWWVWGSPKQEVFDALKKAATSAPILTFPSQSGRFCLKCDASNFVTGAVLSQPQADDMHQPIAFMSKGFSDVEHNYQIHDKEMLAIMCALDEWHHFLEGMTEKFEILTDHQNLTYFQDAQKLNCQQEHWSLFLSHFNFSLCHQPGWLMGKPDTLSQRSDHPHGKDDNANITLLPSDVFEVHNTEATLVDSGGDELVERIWRSMDYDDAVVKALRELGAGTLRSDKWERDGNLVMYRGCVYVPKDPQLRHDIVHAHHDSMMTGHPGWWKPLELVSHNYWWLGISCYVASYVAGCNVCNHCKSFLTQKVGKLTPNRIPTHCWEVISVDTIGELPESKGYNAILVAVDRLSKHIHTVPTVTMVDSAGVARLFLEHVWRHHGLPEAVISDRGSTFVSNFSRELATLLDIRLTPSTAYHLQMDRQMEQVNQDIEAYLRVFVSHCQDDWADWLPLAEFAYNNHIHSATCHTPFELDSGQHPRMGLEPTWSSTVEAADDFAQQMSQMQDKAKAALEHATDEMAQYYDCWRSPTPAYEVRAKVWLNAQNYMTTCPTKKLDHKRLGPFEIEKAVSTATDTHPLSPHQSRIQLVLSH